MIVSQGKMSFMSKVFANLIFQSYLAYITAKSVIENQEMSLQVMQNSLFIWITSLLLILSLVLAKLPTYIRFLIFSMFSILVGALLSSIKQFDKESIKEALAGTIAIFVTMFFAGIISSQFNIDLVPLALVLFIALLGTLIYSFFKKDASKIFLVIFSLYILVDTNLMLRKDYRGNFVNGSLNYFIDIINIFSDLLKLQNN